MNPLSTSIACLGLALACSAQTWIKNPTNGHYYAFTPTMTWTQAEAQAVKWGGHLATVRNLAESDWIYFEFAKAGNKAGGWIGYSDQAKEGTWVWSSGETSTYTHWAKNQPDNMGGGEHFGQILGNSQPEQSFWNDTNKSYQLPGVVELSTSGAFTTFGAGCSSATTLPTVSATSAPPSIGITFTMEANGFLPRPQFGWIILGLSNTNWGAIPLPLTLAVLGMDGCTLYTSPDFIFPTISDTKGSTPARFQIPNDVGLIGAFLFGQFAMPDPKANITGVATSNAFKVVIGT